MSRAAALLLLLVVSGCGTAVRSAPSAPTPPREAAAARDSTAAPWRIVGVERPRSQRVDISAIIDSRIDTTLRSDTLATRSWYDWSEHPDASPRRIAGMLRAFALRTGSDSLWRVLDAPTLPVSFAAEIPQGGLVPELVTPRADGCDPQAALVPGWRETWVSPPSLLDVGTTWRDSSNSPLCRDGIVLQVSSQREFVVTGAVVRAGTLRVVVRRTSRAVIRGSGVQFGDSVHFEGSASGEMQLELLPAGAVIAAGSGTSELRLTMRGRRRTQELVQRSALEISVP
jgi:hypothetical protein